VEGDAIRYIDWLFPGILAMNMMFSALWGVGYIIVRYRKNGVLKRLKATPLTAFEYMTAQALSRIFLLLFTLAIVWVGSDLLFSFRVAGSYLDLFIVFFIGAMSLTSIGLLLAARGTSEEFASGALNFIAWPMMFLSEVWFSLEGAPGWVKTLSQFLPLTHLLQAARKIMNDGATLLDVSGQCSAMLATTLACLVLGALLFSWNE
jgi:ABC-type multidrug transport system permease subunit